MKLLFLTLLLLTSVVLADPEPTPSTNTVSIIKERLQFRPIRPR